MAIQVTEELTERVMKGRFRLTKFVSWASIPVSERADTLINLGLDELLVQRALGMQWNDEKDTFQLKVINLDKLKTKRGILSAIASLY